MLRNISKQIQGSATIVPTNSPKHSRRAKKHQKWETLKTEAYRLYIKEDNTLQSTMLKIEEEFSFKASPRKWKLKLKEWGFDKYLSKSNMVIVAAKAEKHYREIGEETVFYHRDRKISRERIKNFKRKISEHDHVFCNSNTSPNISYLMSEPEMPVILRSKKLELGSLASPHIEWVDLEQLEGPDKIAHPLDLVQDLENSYPILKVRYLDHSHLISLWANLQSCYSFDSLTKAVVRKAQEYALEDKASKALFAYFLAMILLLKRKEIAKNELLEFTNEFLDLQEKDGFLPAILNDVLRSYRQLLTDIQHVYGVMAPITMRMRALTYRLQQQSIFISRLGLVLFPGLPDSEHEGLPNIFFTSNNYSPPALGQHGDFYDYLGDMMLDPGTCLKRWHNGSGKRELRTPEASQFELTIPISIHSVMRSIKLAQNKIRFLPTKDKRRYYAQLVKRFCELSFGLSAYAVPFSLYMVANTDAIIFGDRKPTHFSSERALRETSMIEAIMRLGRTELQETLPNLFGTIENRVQEWLGLDILFLEAHNTTMKAWTENRNSDDHEIDVQSRLDVMDISFDEDEDEDLDMLDPPARIVMGFNEPDRHIVELDDEEMAECSSIVTDSRSSKYGITYTESVISGISYNYTALFPV